MLKTNLKILSLPISYEDLASKDCSPSLVVGSLDQSLRQLLQALALWLRHHRSALQNLLKSAGGSRTTATHSRHTSGGFIMTDRNTGQPINTLVCSDGAEKDRGEWSDGPLTAEDIEYIGSHSTEASDFKAGLVLPHPVAVNEASSGLRLQLVGKKGDREGLCGTGATAAAAASSSSITRKVDESKFLEGLKSGSVGSKRLLESGGRGNDLNLSHSTLSASYKFLEEEKLDDSIYPNLRQELKEAKAEIRQLRKTNDDLQEKVANYIDLVQDYPLYYDPNDRVFKNCRDANEKLRKVNKRLAKSRAAKKEKEGRRSASANTLKQESGNCAGDVGPGQVPVSPANDLQVITPETTTSLMTKRVGKADSRETPLVRGGQGGRIENGGEDKEIVKQLEKAKSDLETREKWILKLKEKIRSNEKRLHDHMGRGLVIFLSC